MGASGDGESLQKFSLSSWEASYPTPGCMNIMKGGSSGSSVDTKQSINIGESASSTNSNATSTIETPATTTGSGAQSVVISEILFNAEGTDEGKEFIELYNPYPNPINIDGWKLRMRVGNGEEQSLAEIQGENGLPVLIPAQGFYLVGFYKYNSEFFGGRIADTIRSRTLPNGGSTTIISLYNDLGIFDEMQYSSSSVREGESLERKSFLNLLCTAQTFSHEAEYFGNACDTGSDSDFMPRLNPLPQNSKSLPEPRERFLHPIPIDGINIGTYNRDSLSIKFAWNPIISPDARIPKYRISTFSSSSPAIETIFIASTTAEARVFEVGTSYNFSLVAEDEEGFQSQPILFFAHVPSLFENVYVYKDVAMGTNRYIFDGHFSEFPFIPNVFGRNAFQGIVVYKNALPDILKTTLTTQNNFRGEVSLGQMDFQYSRCVGGFWENREGAIVFAIDSSNCGAGGGLNNSAMPFSNPEDNHIEVQFADKPSDVQFSSSDYFTVAFYDMSDSGGGWQGLALVAYDKTPHYFSESPNHFVAPIIHSGFSVSFASSSSELILNIPQVSDVDSGDGGLLLESNFSPLSSGVLDETKWTGIEQKRIVFPGDAFLIGIRAKDTEGNVSNILTTTWTYPIAKIVFEQSQNNSWSSGSFGGVSQNSMEPDSALFQSIISSSSISFDSILLNIKRESGGYEGSVRVAVFEGNENGPDVSKLLGVTQKPVGNNASGNEEIFSFASSITCPRDTHCWFVVDVPGYSDPRGYFWSVWRVGTAGSDVYAGISGTGSGSGRNTFPEYTSFSSPVSDDWYMKLYKTE